jgi:hypothetical protein
MTLSPMVIEKSAFKNNAEMVEALNSHLCIKAKKCIFFV